MAGNKKKIDDFREAMLSNARYFGKEQDEDAPVDNPIGSDDIMVGIDKKIYSQFKILSAYLNEDRKDLIEQALNHYLRLKSAKLERAMMELTDDKNKE